MDAVLQTKRLLLRRARLSDRDAYLELRNSPYVMDCNPMAPITPEQAERQLEKDQASGRAFYLEERATGLLAGVVWLSPTACATRWKASPWSTLWGRRSPAKA